MSKIFNETPRSDLANAIAFFDFEETNLNLREWFYITLQFYETHGLIPTIMDITGPNGVKGNTNILVKNGAKKLEECLFKGVNGFWIGATPSSNKHNTFISLMTLDLSLERQRKSFSLAWDPKIISFKYENMIKVFKDFYSFFKPRYGYGFQRAFSQSPGAYAEGIIMGLNPYIKDPLLKQKIKKEREKIGKWSHNYIMSDGDYKTGDLRDIYPYNLICKAHLERKVLGMSLEKWILSTNSGTLESFETDRWIWYVPEDKIAKVREALSPTGIILCI